MTRLFIVVLCLLVARASTAYGGISVRTRAFGSTDNTAWISPTSGITNNYSGWLSNAEGITVAVSGDGDWWFRCANPSTESIGQIVFTGSGNVRVFICAPDGSGFGPADITNGTRLGSPGCLHLGNVTPGGTTMVFQAVIGGDVKDLHSPASANPKIEAERIVRLDVDGGMTKPIIIHNSTSAELSLIRVANSIADDLSSTGDPLTVGTQPRIESKGGKIALIQTTGSSASIEVPVIVRAGGEIGGIFAGGDLGGGRNDSVPPAYKATLIYAGTVGDIVGKNVRSDIQASVGVKHVESNGTDPTGGIRGFLKAPTLLNQTSTSGALIKSANSFNMTVTLDTFPANALLSIGSYFGYPTTILGGLGVYPIIQIDNPHAFAGQIIINAKNITNYGVANTPYANVPGPFRGYVRANTNTDYVTIEAADYSDATSTIGGGSVGVVPFGLHASSCNPYPARVGRTDGVLQTLFFTNNTMPVTFESYGPFKASSGTLSGAVLFEACDMNDDCHWIGNAAPLFSVVFNPTSAGDAASRTIGIKCNSVPPPPGIYRVSIYQNKLVCKDIDPSAGNVVMDWPQFCQGTAGEAFAYEFRIAPDCTAGGEPGLNDFWEIDQDRLNHPNMLTLDRNGNDIIDGCEMSNPCDCDWNGNRVFEVQDIFDFLRDWFAGCTAFQTPNSLCRASADFNHQSGATVQDIFDFLSCWFAHQC